MLYREINLSIVFKRFFGRRQPKQGKPPILPPSKKVLYHVINVPWQKKEDVEESLWRRHVYNNAMISLREIFREEVDMKESAGLGLEALRLQEKEELDKFIEMNEERNKKRKEARDIREKEELLVTKEKILEKIEKTMELEEKNINEKKEEVLKLIEESYNFVTKENLDQKLEEALENPTTFSYAIDLNGRVIKEDKPAKYALNVWGTASK
uniref:Small ribosomal subunit protein mS26 n=1 Tax=Parastrongyloides trichosuri TaxID=131310 RepID=A0A0N4ZPU2_PARTI